MHIWNSWVYLIIIIVGNMSSEKKKLKKDTRETFNGSQV